MKIFNFNEFLFEGKVAEFSKNIQIDFEIDADEHYFKRLSRPDNEPDKNGSTIIEEEEVINDIKAAIPQIVNRNLFNIGIYWKGDRLIKDLCIINTNTYLNIIIIVNKIKKGTYGKYKFTIGTVMRNSKFIIKEDTTHSIYL
jgi:hypothetical protein